MKGSCWNIEIPIKKLFSLFPIESPRFRGSKECSSGGIIWDFFALLRDHVGADMCKEVIGPGPSGH